jgi:hypothetical protein
MKRFLVITLLSVAFVSCNSKKQSDQAIKTDSTIPETLPASNSTSAPSTSGSSGYVYQDNITRLAIQDAIAEYNKARRGNDKSMISVSAGVVAELYRQNGDEPNYRIWKNIEDEFERQLESEIQRQTNAEVERIQNSLESGSGNYDEFN